MMRTNLWEISYLLSDGIKNKFDILASLKGLHFETSNCCQPRKDNLNITAHSSQAIVAIAEVAWGLHQLKDPGRKLSNPVCHSGKRWKMNTIVFIGSPKVHLVKLDCNHKKPRISTGFFYCLVNSFFFDIDENEPKYAPALF